MATEQTMINENIQTTEELPMTDVEASEAAVVEKKKTNYLAEFTKGILKQNPLLVLLLGTCPALAVTTSLENGLGMGLAATFVLAMSNLVISLLREYIPDKVRIPSYITIIAAFVTILKFVMEAQLPALDEALGIFIPLITVNCIILGRAEAFASKNKPLASMVDGLGMGVGFTIALIVIGSIREILGNGSIGGWPLPFVGEGKTFQPILIFVMPPGGFLIFGLVIAGALALTRKFYAQHPDAALEVSPCASGCAGCGLAQECAGSLTPPTVQSAVVSDAKNQAEEVKAKANESAIINETDSNEGGQA